MLVRICGSRGSVPSPGAEKLRYGGNTSCVQVVLSDGTHLILDAGTGICNLPAHLGTSGGQVNILLTHLHLDHIQGLLFFSPLFEAHSRVMIWGPLAPGVSLRNRVARCLSTPLTPVDVRELPVHDCQYTDLEYPGHLGWGHSAISRAVEFADRCDATRTLLFHHDPHHTDDQLDAVFEDALRRWRDLGRAEDAIAMASEGDELTIAGRPAATHAIVAPACSSG